jgi:hypothetical protein
LRKLLGRVCFHAISRESDTRFLIPTRTIIALVERVLLWTAYLATIRENWKRVVLLSRMPFREWMETSLVS